MKEFYFWLFALNSRNRRKVNLSRIIFSLLIISIIFSSTACSDDRPSTSIPQTSYKVFGEFSTKILETGTEIQDEPTIYVTSTLVGNTIAVLEYVDNLKDNVVTREYSVLFYDFSGAYLSKTKLSISLEDMEIVIHMAADSEGNIIIVSQIQTISEDAMTFTDTATRISTFNSSGNQINEPVEISQNFEDGWIKVLMDSKNNLYVLCSSEMYVFDNHGKDLYTIKDKRIGTNALLIGDEVFVEVVDTISENCLSSKFYMLDSKKQSLAFSVEMTKYSTAGLTLLGCKDGLFSGNEDGIFAYEFSLNKMMPILDFRNSDFDYNRDSDQIAILSKDAIIIRRATDDGNIQVVLVVARNTETQDMRQVITLGGLGLTFYPELCSEVDEFNKTNPDYQIVLIDYLTNMSTIESQEYGVSDSLDTSAKTRLNLDILSDNAPDILISDDSLPISSYVKQDVFVDLYTFMKKDDNFNTDEYVSNLFKISETEGCLYKIGTKFIISGFAGKESIIGDRIGWTFEEFNNMLPQMPQNMKAIYPNQTKENLVANICSYNTNSFVNMNNLTADFDSINFYRVLEFANTYGVNEVNISEDYYESFQKYALMNLPIRSFSDYIQIEKNFGESISVVGYPTQTSSSAAVSFPFFLSISSKTAVANGSWEFIKFLLSEDQQRKSVIDELASSYYLPMCRSTMQSEIEMSLNTTEGLAADYSYIGLYQSPPLNEDTEKRFLNLVYSLDTLNTYASDINSIVQEETAAYFADQKTEKDVAEIIQNRVQTLINE